VIVFVITIVVLLIVGAWRGSYGRSAEEQKRDFTRQVIGPFTIELASV
jgi:hypothetical protein